MRQLHSLHGNGSDRVKRGPAPQGSWIRRATESLRCRHVRRRSVGRFGDIRAGPGAVAELGARQDGPRTVHAGRMDSWPPSCRLRRVWRMRGRGRMTGSSRRTASPPRFHSETVPRHADSERCHAVRVERRKPSACRTGWTGPIGSCRPRAARRDAGSAAPSGASARAFG